MVLSNICMRTWTLRVDSLTRWKKHMEYGIIEIMWLPWESSHAACELACPVSSKNVTFCQITLKDRNT
eukprot:5043654-Pyramimonas_sp.AAC.3